MRTRIHPIHSTRVHLHSGCDPTHAGYTVHCIRCCSCTIQVQALLTVLYLYHVYVMCTLCEYGVVLVCFRTAPSHQNPATLMPDAQFPHQMPAPPGFHRNIPVRNTFSHPVRRVTHDGINMTSHASASATGTSRSFFGKLALKFSRRLVLLTV